MNCIEPIQDDDIYTDFMSNKNIKVANKNLRLLQALSNDEEIKWVGKSHNSSSTRLSRADYWLAYGIGLAISVGAILAFSVIERKLGLVLIDGSFEGRGIVYVAISLFLGVPLAIFSGTFLLPALKKIHFSRAIFVATNQRFFEFLPDAGITQNCFVPEDIDRVLLSENIDDHSDVIVVGKSLDGVSRRVIVAENEDAQDLYENLVKLKNSQ